MRPPYDTGKVKIGSHYIPPQRNVMSADAERLQRALLRTPQRYIDASKAETMVVIKDSLMWIAFTCVMIAMMLTPQIFTYFIGA